MGTRGTDQLLMTTFKALENRDSVTLVDVFDPNVEFHWPPALPYGGVNRIGAPEPTWISTWTPLQPTRHEREMDPVIVASSPQRAAVLWHQRGQKDNGMKLDTEVLGMYNIRNDKLVRCQMFYFDCEEVMRFLART